MAKKTLETSTDYSNPYRPLPIAIFNSVGRITEKMGLLGNININSLLANARKKTGLQGFGDEWFLEPLNVLVNAINKEAQLTPLGKLIQKGRLEAALMTRLRIEDTLKKNPEIDDIDLGNIILIAGLQRTGTTTLHRLIAADPNMRSLISWEALNPVPLPGDKLDHPKARIAQAKMAEKGLAYLAPDFFAIHPVEHDAPEEDVLLLDLCFMSQAPEATMYVPSYAAWLEAQDHTKAYEYLHTTLKVLHHQRPAKNWVLKTPHHMEYLDVIQKVFPKATIVQTHRDPQKTTGSFCSMVTHGRGIFSDHVDAKEVARHWVKKVQRLMELSIKVRNESKSNRFIDVSYYDLLENPINELKKIYQLAEIPFDATALQEAENTSKNNVKNRHGKHIYHLKDFGLSTNIIEKNYAFYRAQYNIPYE
jgi:hypothetical protein